MARGCVGKLISVFAAAVVAVAAVVVVPWGSVAAHPGGFGDVPGDAYFSVPRQTERVTLVGSVIKSRPLSGDTYTADEHIEIEFRYSAAVIYGHGDAWLTVGSGTEARTRAALFVGGSGTSTLLYRYRVRADDVDSDGVSLPGNSLLALGVASGLVTGADGSGSVSLVLGALGAQSGHKVNGATTGCAHLYCTDVSVGAVSVALGAIDYGPGAYTGYLSNWSFRSRDEEYIVSQLLVRGSAGRLEMVLDREPEQSLINGGVLLAGEYGYLFSDAEWNAATKRLTWRDTELSWSSGDEIRVYVDDGSRQSSDHVAASNVGQAGTSIEFDASGSSGVKHVAVSVTVGDRPVTVYEVGVSAGIFVAGNNGTQLSLLSDVNGSPGARLGILDRVDHVGAGLLVYDLPSSTQPVLNANTTYWFAITVLRDSRRQLVVASSAVMDSSSSRGWRIGSRTLGTSLETIPSNPAFWSQFGTNQPLRIEIKASEHVDLLAARVVSVPLSHSTFPDGDTFGRGDRIEVEYTFDGPVTYSSGRAFLAIDQTTGLRRSPTAGYVAGSGTNKLLYAHEVASFDNDVDGFTIPADSLGSDASGLLSGRDGGIAASHAAVGTGLRVRGSSTTCDRHACIDVSTADLGGGKIGASPASGSLSRRTLSFAGDAYVVREVASTSSGGLELQLDRSPTALMLSDVALVLHHDSGESVFSFSDAVVDADNRLTWGTGGPGWTASSTVRVDVGEPFVLLSTSRSAANSGSVVLADDGDGIAVRVRTGTNDEDYLIERLELGCSVGGDAELAAAAHTVQYATPSSSDDPGERVGRKLFDFVRSASSSGSVQFEARGLFRSNKGYYASDESQNEFVLVVERANSLGTVSCRLAQSELVIEGARRFVRLEYDASSHGFSVFDDVAFSVDDMSRHLRVPTSARSSDDRLSVSGSRDWVPRFRLGGGLFTDSAATGAPVVKGIGEVGETLWADVSGIADADGLSGVEFSYQWKRTPAAVAGSTPGAVDISGATSELYRLVDADLGADVSVEVGFADDPGVRYVVEADEGLTVGARASFLVGNLGTAVGADVDGGGSVGGLAQSFSTGTHAAAVLEAVRLRLGVGSGSVSVSVHSDAGAAPGTSLETLGAPSIVDASAATAEEFASTGLALAAGTTYWVVVTADAGTATVSVGSSSVTEEDAAPAAGWSVGDSYSSRSGTAWTAQSATGAAARVLAVGVRGTTIPVVEVQFGARAYTVSVGSSATVEVSLSADPERTVVIPITVTNQGGVTTADYSGVPTSVTFNPGETSKSFVFVATPDSDHDGGGSVTLSFGTLPAEVTAGTTSQTVIFIIPAAVSNLDATPGDQFVTLNWDDPGNSSITRYQYRYRVTSAEAWNPDWTDIPGSSAVTASYTVTGLINNVDYTFEVRVVSDGVEGAEASVAATPIGPPTLPGKPLHLGITRGNQVLTVSWSNGPDEDERAPVTTYEVRYRRVGTASWTTVSRSNDDLSTHQRIPELTNQVAYEVQVRAVNRIGPGAWTTGKGTPQAPPQHAPGPAGDEAFDVGRLGAYWADPDAGGNTLWKESCTGAQSFRIIWTGPEDDTRPVKWAAHVVTRGGAGTVSYKFLKSEGSQGYYEMRGTVTVEGESSISISVRGRFGVTWGKWSPPVSLYCFETAQDGDSATPGPLNNVKGASVLARPLRRSRRHLDAQSHNVL